MREDRDLVIVALGEYRGRPRGRDVLRYVIARYNKEAVTMSYRHYVTESLRLAPQMMYLTSSWLDLVARGREPERTADEIIDDLIERLSA